MNTDLRTEIEQWAKDWAGENSFDPGMEGLGELHAILDQDAILAAHPDKSVTEPREWNLSDVAMLCDHGYAICARCNMVPDSWQINR